MKKMHQAQRRAYVRVALWLTKNTPLAPDLSERKLLAEFVRGFLTIDQVLALLESRPPAAQPSEVLQLVGQPVSRIYS